MDTPLEDSSAATTLPAVSGGRGRSSRGSWCRGRLSSLARLAAFTGARTLGGLAGRALLRGAAAEVGRAGSAVVRRERERLGDGLARDGRELDVHRRHVDVGAAAEQEVVARVHHGHVLVGDLHAGHAVGEVRGLHGQPRAAAAALGAVLDVAAHGAVHELPLDAVAGRVAARELLEHRRGQVQVALAALGALVHDVDRHGAARVAATGVVARDLGAAAAVERRVPLRAVERRVVVAHARVVHEVAVAGRHLPQRVGCAVSGEAQN
ncbi:hypothetical protein ON010_g13935 [Phytophthora cinnamomi]|nr:hypothetical protein ON010_g13935 [Phytophthora cinnamomi]